MSTEVTPTLFNREVGRLGFLHETHCDVCWRSSAITHISDNSTTIYEPDADWVRVTGRGVAKYGQSWNVEHIDICPECFWANFRDLKDAHFKEYRKRKWGKEN